MHHLSRTSLYLTRTCPRSPHARLWLTSELLRFPVSTTSHLLAFSNGSEAKRYVNITLCVVDDGVRWINSCVCEVSGAVRELPSRIAQGPTLHLHRTQLCFFQQMTPFTTRNAMFTQRAAPLISKASPYLAHCCAIIITTIIITTPS